MRLIDADALIEILTTAIMGMKGMAKLLNAEDDPEIKMEIKAYTDILNGVKEQPTIEPDLKWIPVSERLPEEDHWLGGSGKQFSDNVLISILNRNDDDEWVDTSHTVDGEWMLELPRYCEIVAWMPLPEPYRREE